MASPTPEAPVGRIKAPRAHPAPLLFLTHTLPPGDTRARLCSCKAPPLPPSGFQLRAATPTSGLQQTEADPRLWTPQQLPHTAGHLGSPQGGLRAPGANPQGPVRTQGWTARVALQAKVPLPAR